METVGANHEVEPPRGRIVKLDLDARFIFAQRPDAAAKKGLHPTLDFGIDLRHKITTQDA
jgi:hypothetical protein